MKHLNKVSKNLVEKSIQDWYFANGFQSLKSGNYRVAYGILPDGSPNFEKRKGVNGHI